MQFLNCLEGLMYYAVTQRAATERSLTTMIRLHEIHAENSEKLQVTENKSNVLTLHRNSRVFIVYRKHR